MDFSQIETDILGKTISFVKDALKTAESGHDWWHISRVVANAENIGKAYPESNLFIVKMVALLHDVDDWKFKEQIKQNKSEEFLKSLQIDQVIIDQILSAIEKISFKGSGVSDEIESLEGKIVQDADRLDALGAIGIARCFSYGGFRNREIFNPEKPFKMHNSFEEYKSNNGTSINHFYEKLLLLKDRMKTGKGKELAQARHDYMVGYLEKFMKEWEGQA